MFEIKYGLMWAITQPHGVWLVAIIVAMIIASGAIPWIK